MSIAERLSRWTVLEFLEAVAVSAEDFAQQSGVGGMETAGSLISYLVEHPKDIEPFMIGGISELPVCWWMHGRLSWHASKGARIIHPEDVRPADRRLVGEALS